MLLELRSSDIRRKLVITGLLIRGVNHNTGHMIYLNLDVIVMKLSCGSRINMALFRCELKKII